MFAGYWVDISQPRASAVKLTLDMRDLGERCSKHRVAKLLKQEGLQAQRGYRRRPSPRGGQPAVVAPNVLEQQFSVEMPNQAWVTDITYIRTHEGSGAGWLRAGGTAAPPGGSGPAGGWGRRGPCRSRCAPHSPTRPASPTQPREPPIPWHPEIRACACV